LARFEVCEDYRLLGCEAVWSDRLSLLFLQNNQITWDHVPEESIKIFSLGLKSTVFQTQNGDFSADMGANK
jgi:hypothetical protein